ncbi:MAG: AcrB/AcrD/AcrF family protein [Methylococcus sp.]|nr:MAG: AcrB/AcrD/AcrF family protein [Methylococcus sp.]
MKSIIEFSLQQRVFFNLVFVVLILAGSYSVFQMPVDRYPNVNFGEVIINTHFPGASPSEVETLVTREIEDALEPVRNIAWIKATSFRERSRIHLKFIDDTDYKSGYDEIRFNVLNRLDKLPTEADPPELINLETEDFLPVVVVNLVGDIGNRALALMAEELKPDLRQIPGVAKINIIGEYEREFQILLDPAKLNALGVTFDDVARALELTGVSIPAGYYKDQSGQFTVRVDEKFRNPDQALSTIIRTDSDGSFVRVSDVSSQARLGYKDPAAITSVNGRGSLSIQVIKSPTSNALDIRDRVQLAVAHFGPVAKAQNVEIVLTQDSTVYINDRLTTLGMNMIAGVTLVTLIIWYFMGVRNAGLIAVGIPFSFMLSTTLMHLTGMGINEISLFSFILVTGIIVDDAIVVTENIYRHIEKGEALQEAIINGVTEVALPVISATMTTIAAFMPMLIMTGVTGEFFEVIPKTVSFAIFASLIECLLILPVHYLQFGPRPGHTDEMRTTASTGRVLAFLQQKVEQGLHLTLEHRTAVFSLVIALFLVAITILGLSISGRSSLIRIKFFPDDYTLYYIDVEGRSNTPIEEVDSHLRKIARYVMNDGSNMATAAAGAAGFYFSEDYEQIFGHHYGTVMVTLPSRPNQGFESPAEHLLEMNRRLTKEFQNEVFRLSLHPQKDGPPQGKDLNVRVLGSNMESITRLADELMRFIKTSPGIGPRLQGLKDDRGQTRRIIRFRIRHERAAEYGLTPARVARLAASVLDGRIVGKFRLADDDIDLKIAIDPAFYRRPEDALYIPVMEDSSGPVRLADLATIETYMEPGELNRYDYQRSISIQANLDPSAPTSIPVIVEKIQQHHDSIRQDYPGATVSFGGEHEATRRSYTSLSYAFILAFLLIYLILSSQFQSYIQPAIILSTISFALIGVVFGKLVSQTLFTLNSFIAAVGVAGVVVNDALVLIDLINKNYRAGMNRREALFAGVHQRLRPILLTTLTTTLGLLPMAVGFPSYSQVWGSMASTFVSGLATATALTVFMVPVLWDLFQCFKEKQSTGRSAR